MKTEREQFESAVRRLGLAMFFGWEEGRGYIDADTWKSFAVWQAARKHERDQLVGTLGNLLDGARKLQMEEVQQ